MRYKRLITKGLFMGRAQFFVIGDPVSHSLSPLIYNTLFDMFHIKADYRAMCITPNTLGAFIASIPIHNIYGFNVTMPLKMAVMPYLRFRDPDARFGVNTVCVTHRGLYGWSTDGDGFRISLAMDQFSYVDKRMVFIGCGGAGRSIIADALSQQIASLTIINRTPENAAVFTSDRRVRVCTFDDAERVCRECDLLVNTTPLGMRGYPDQFEDLTFIEELPESALVVDIIYDPVETEFLAAAKAHGNKTYNGLGMLVWQALLAFQRFTKEHPIFRDAAYLINALTKYITEH